MQKKLIALAIAGAFVAPAAFAESGNVTIYGKMDVSFDLVDAGAADNVNQTANAAAKSAGRMQGINSNTSYIGFKGSEDLGNGLSAIWQVESQVSPDNNGTASAQGNTFASRNTFVGLSGKSWGTFLMGRHDTPYKMATRNLDLFGDGVADNRSIMGGGSGYSISGGAAAATTGAGNVASFDGRNNNTMAYVSPNMNGFTVIAGYVLLNENNYAAAATNGLNTLQNTTNTQDKSQAKAYSLAGLYTNGPWFASLAYERHSFGHDGGVNTGIADAQEHATKLGVGYASGPFSVGVAYEKLADDLNKNNLAGAACGTQPNGNAYTGSECSGNSNWYLAGKYAFGNNAVKLAYTKAGDRSIGSETGARQWTLGLDHDFSKRTKIYALYTKLSNDKYGRYAIGSATSNGAYTASATNAANSAYGVAGASQDAWSFGIKHSF